MAFSNFKKPVYRDPSYLFFIRNHPCTKCGEGLTEPHHFETGGMGMKCSDYRTLPLCRICHGELHNEGKMTFFQTMNPEIEMIKLLEEYIDACKDMPLPF